MSKADYYLLTLLLVNVLLNQTRNDEPPIMFVLWFILGIICAVGLFLHLVSP